jgi:hypothetical protein
MATKPTVKKVKNGNLSKNGNVKIKTLSKKQIEAEIAKGAQKNETSTVGKAIAKLQRALSKFN